MTLRQRGAMRKSRFAGGQMAAVLREVDLTSVAQALAQGRVLCIDITAFWRDLLDKSPCNIPPDRPTLRCGGHRVRQTAPCRARQLPPRCESCSEDDPQRGLR